MRTSGGINDLGQTVGKPRIAGLSDGVNAAYTNTPDEWLALANIALTALIESGQPFSQADLRRYIPEPDKPQRWGSFWAAARQKRLIRSIGWVDHRPHEKSDVQAIRQYIGVHLDRERAA